MHIYRSVRRALTLAACFLAAGAATASAAGDVVIYAKRATVVAGAWNLVNDTSAAGGARMENPDSGAVKIDAALVSPTNYFEATFTVETGRPYHLWIRAKAQNNAWTNDSVFVQFSGSVTSSGSGKFRIGTTSSMIYSLEEASGAGLSGWGWQDNGYGYSVLGEDVYFSGTSQTIRVQRREDGISIDQIVLSPATYATASPGATKNDTTMLAETGATSTSTTTTTTTSGFAWANFIRATASGSAVQKISGCDSCADAGATSGAATSVSFTVQPSHRLSAGLATDPGSNTSASVINYAFQFSGTSTWAIREKGIYRGEGGFGSSDVFKVAVEGGAVNYYQNGNRVYTSQVPVPGALVVDASLESIGATVAVASAATGTSTTTTTAPPPTSASGFTWANAVNASASGSSVQKVSGCGSCADAGATSAALATAVSFSVSSTQRLTAGLGRDTSANTSAKIDYAFRFYGTGGWDIRELGVYRTEGTFTSSDVFQVGVEGTTVKYYRNGGLVYTSTVPVSAPLVVDASLETIGAAVQVVSAALSGTAPAPTATTEPAPTGSIMRVLQWNIHHGGYGTDNVYDPNRVATWVAKMNPDVVMFNEIEKYTSWGNQDQPEVYKALLQQKTGKTWYYLFAQEWGQWDANGKGSLILSTYPINVYDRHELIYNYDRCIGMATITVNNRDITLLTAHLDPYDSGLRLLQATEVTNWAAAQPENRILAGDMNAWPDQSSIAQINKTYYDSWAIAAANGTATAFSGNSGETKSGRIDYIFYSKASLNLTVKASQVFDTRDANGVMPSDHRPVLTTFEVK